MLKFILSVAMVAMVGCGKSGSNGGAKAASPDKKPEPPPIPSPTINEKAAGYWELESFSLKEGESPVSRLDVQVFNGGQNYGVGYCGKTRAGVYSGIIGGLKADQKIEFPDYGKGKEIKSDTPTWMGEITQINDTTLVINERYVYRKFNPGRKLSALQDGTDESLCDYQTNQPPPVDSAKQACLQKTDFKLAGVPEKLITFDPNCSAITLDEVPLFATVKDVRLPEGGAVCPPNATAVVVLEFSANQDETVKRLSDLNPTIQVKGHQYPKNIQLSSPGETNDSYYLPNMTWSLGQKIEGATLCKYWSQLKDFKSENSALTQSLLKEFGYRSYNLVPSNE